ncbi:hypothetical protein EON67_06435 [archaeon]|nr:MAG: hypothetical protein EON67_06435 [archaeon]
MCACLYCPHCGRCRLQPVDATRTRQIECWRDMLLAYHAAHKQTLCSVKDWSLWANAAISRTCACVGVNVHACKPCRAHTRTRGTPVSVAMCVAGRLSDEGIAAVTEHMVKTGTWLHVCGCVMMWASVSERATGCIGVMLLSSGRAGAAEWDDAAHTRLHIFYKTPAEWAAIIHAWVVHYGLAEPGNICTIYELHSGDSFRGAEFFGLDTTVLYKAVESLQSSGLVRDTGPRVRPATARTLVLEHPPACGVRVGVCRLSCTPRTP